MALASVACSGEPAPPLAAGEPLIWQVTDADSTAYIIGAIHALPEDFEWSSKRADELFASADRYWRESRTDDAEYESGRALLRTNTPLADRIDGDTLSRASNALKVRGRDISEFDGFITGFAAQSISEVISLTDNGMDFGLGVEAHFEALAEGQESRELETFARQMRLFTDMSDEQGEELLRYALDKEDGLVTDASPEVEDVLQMWARGDAAAMDELVEGMQERRPWFHEAVLPERNREWAERFDAHLRATSGTEFVAVGMAHLHGPEAFQDILADRGYRVTLLTPLVKTSPKLQ